MKKFNYIEWIFFDIGSTLMDETKCYEKRFEETVCGTDISMEEFKDKVIEFFCRNLKGDYEAVNYYGLSLPKWHSELEFLYPEAEYVLKKLKSKGYKLGIIANQPPGTQERLKHYSIADYFEIIISSAEEGVSKPDLKIFQAALERMGCRAENCVMVGDRLDNDIVPAKQIGMKTVWIKQGFARYSSPQSETEQADFTVNSLSEIPDLPII